MPGNLMSSLSSPRVASIGDRRVGRRVGPALLLSRSGQRLLAGVVAGRLSMVGVGGLACLWICLVAAGCGRSKPGVGKIDDVRQNMQRIGVGYNQATLKLGRPPRNVDELLPYLQDPQRPGQAKDLLRSPNDGEQYVIIWDVDFGELAKKIPKPYVVFAYEKHGKGGKRHAMQLPNFVSVMTDAEFQKAPFPPGYQPQL